MIYLFGLSQRFCVYAYFGMDQILAKLWPI